MRIAIQQLTCPICKQDWTKPNTLVLSFGMDVMTQWEQDGNATSEGALMDKDGLISRGFWDEVRCKCGFDKITCMNVFN